MTSRKLSKDEHDLWRRAVRDVAPFQRPGADIMGPAAPAAKKTPLPPRRAAGPGPQGRGTSSSDAFAAGDPRLDRHAGRGRLPIDATFDLHGHNQASARAALYGFLLEARHRGHRCVLVITGKGARDVGGRQTGGVLRASLRDWLKEDAFRQHIVRASAAHQRHGGGGAFYLFLKAARRNK